MHFADLRIPLAIALLLAVLLDALITRTGWTFPELALAEKFKQSRKNKKLTPNTNIPSAAAVESIPQKQTKVEQEAKQDKPEQKEAPPLSNTDRQSRFSRAKKGRK